MEYAASRSQPVASSREGVSARPEALPFVREIGSRAVTAIVVVAALAILLATFAIERARHVASARSQAQSEARALAAHLRELLAAADALLLAVQKDAAPAATQADLRRLLGAGSAVEAAHLLHRAGAGPALSVHDRGGAWIAGEQAAAPVAAAILQALRARSPNASVLAAGPDGLLLLRPIRGGDAVLLAGAAAQPDRRSLDRVLGAAGAGGQVVSLRSADGRWLATWPASAGAPDAQRILASAPVEGFACELVLSQAGDAALTAGWQGASPGLLANGLLVALAIAFALWARRRMEREHRDAVSQGAAATQAERSRRDMELLLSGMSRQLRSPLNAVCGLAGALRGMPMPADQAKIVRVLDLSSSVLHGVANDLLDVAALESDARKADFAPVNVREFVDEVVASARAAGGADRLLLDSEVASDVPIVLLADRGRLARVLLHLLHNALRFTHRGAISLSVRRVAREDGGAEVSFAVVDTGWGIPGEVRERLLRPHGTGAATVDAGLAICTRLAIHLGGRLEAMSIDGVGSSVALSVPLEVPASAHSTGDAHASPVSDDARKCLRILVVEDIEGSQMVARMALEQLGHGVVVVADGAAAIRAFRESRFDAILMDIELPGMDGFEATRRIRACGLPGAERVAIIGVSARAAPDDVERAIASGMDAHLAKPISVAAFDAALAGIASRSRSGTADAVPAAVAVAAVAAPVSGQSTALEELARDLGPDLMFAATQQFQRDAEVLLSRLSSAQGAGDGTGVQKAAHGLKGLFRQFGVPALAQVAASLDRNPAAGSPDAAPLVQRLVATAPAAIERVLARAEELARPAR